MHCGICGMGLLMLIILPIWSFYPYLYISRPYEDQTSDDGDEPEMQHVIQSHSIANPPHKIDHPKVRHIEIQPSPTPLAGGNNDEADSSISILERTERERKIRSKIDDIELLWCGRFVFVGLNQYDINGRINNSMTEHKLCWCPLSTIFKPE